MEKTVFNSLSEKHYKPKARHHLESIPLSKQLQIFPIVSSLHVPSQNLCRKNSYPVCCGSQLTGEPRASGTWFPEGHNACFCGEIRSCCDVPEMRWGKEESRSLGVGKDLQDHLVQLHTYHYYRPPNHIRKHHSYMLQEHLQRRLWTTSQHPLKSFCISWSFPFCLDSVWGDRF